MLNSFNPELQLKNTESGIRNKLKDLLKISKLLKSIHTKFTWRRFSMDF